MADSTGYGWAIAKALAEAGATITVGTWPPVLKIFETGLRKGDFAEDMKLSNGGVMKIEKVYPLDAVYDTPADVPEEILNNKRYAGLDGYTISEVAAAVEKDYGKIDILVHSLANGPEVTKPLLETSRKGYLAASSASAYSFVSLLSNFAPIMNEEGSALSLTYIASEKVRQGKGEAIGQGEAMIQLDVYYNASVDWLAHTVSVAVCVRGVAAQRELKCAASDPFLAPSCSSLCRAAQSRRRRTVCAGHSETPR